MSDFKPKKVATVILDGLHSGLTIDEIAKELNRSGLTTKRGRKWQMGYVSTYITRNWGSVKKARARAINLRDYDSNPEITRAVKQAADNQLVFADISPTIESIVFKMYRSGHFNQAEIETVAQALS